MGKNDRVHVFLRVRPNRDRRGPDDEGYAITHTFEKSRIQFHVDKSRRDDEFVNHSVEDYQFEFDRVFGPKTTQEEMFNMVAKDCVLSALDGYNSTIFAYGQTGSGKTYSITGGTESYNDRGIIPRALSLVYDECAKRTDFAWTIRISYLQIYNDKGQDLLNRGKDAKTLDDLPSVTVHETDDEVVLKGLEAHPSNSIHEALNLLFLGDTNRLYCETPMNKTSSRSHCIFSVLIEGRQHGSAVVRRSKLNLVDLAGSERVGKTGVQGNLLTEAKYINLSLHYLEHVIVALSEQSKGIREHVPYRNSFMTMCLRDSLGGNCRTAMLATAHPAQEYFMETISTCKFAQRVACIKQDARVNEETDPTVLVRRLKTQVAQLTEQLAFYRKGDQSADRKMDGDEFERCREVVQRFIDDPDPNANISGINGDLPRILACFKIMKGMLGGKVAIVPGISGMPNSSPTPAAGVSTGTPTPAPASADGKSSSVDVARLKSHVDALTVSLQQKENEISLLFNLVEKSTAPKFNAQTQTGDLSVSYGGMDSRRDSASQGRESAAPHESDPSSLAGLLQQRHHQQQQHQQVSSSPSALPTSSPSPPPPVLSAAELKAQDERMQENYDLTALADADLLRDRQAAFEAFRRSYRKYEQIEKNKADLKGKYDECKGIAVEVNSCVDAIKQLKHRVNQLRADRALQGLAEPHPDEIAAMQQLSDAKDMYKARGAELGKKKEYIDHMHLVMMRSQEQLTKDFDEWFTSRLKQLQVAKTQQQRLLQGNNNANNSNMNISATSSVSMAGSGSRAAVAMTQQQQQNRAPELSSPAYSSPAPAAATFERSRVGAPNPPSQYSSYNSMSASSSYQQQQPSSAPTSGGVLPRGQQQGGNSFGQTYGGGGAGGGTVLGGASFRQRSPPPAQQQQQRQQQQPPAFPATPAQPHTNSVGSGSYYYNNGNGSGRGGAGGGGGGGDAYQEGGGVFARSSSGSTFTETQHIAAMSQHRQHTQQMAAINNVSANSLFAGVGGAAPSPPPLQSQQQQLFTSPLLSSTSSSFAGAQGPLSSSTQKMNPYFPQYPSTGDDAADQQLAAMYKARDEMRARLQQKR